MKITCYPVAALALCLCACQPTRENVKTTPSAEPRPQVAIIKSPNDVREYRSIILDNQLEVVLVSDPDIKKSAAALSVAVGSFQEPEGFGGLAHYLEHMVFLGTKTYPDAAEHAKFISLNGGIENAYTELDHTNYMVAVDNTVFDQALDRFASYFYEALLDERYADKERNAVHSEWTLKGPNDGVILGSLDGITLNSEHPVSQFNWGNLESLSDKPDLSLHSALVDFYERYYSANLMKAVLISSLTLEEMEVLAKKTLGKISNHNAPQPAIAAPAANADHLKKIIRYVPQQDLKGLIIKFVVDNNRQDFALKPNEYLSYLIGSEMPGTPAAVLREEGLAVSLNTYARANEYLNAGSFTIDIELTEQGLANRDRVIGIVFNYLDLVREQGIDEKYYKEISQSLNNRFRFQDKIDDYSYAMGIASELQFVPTPFVLSSRFEYERFSADSIGKLASQLTLENSRLIYIDQAQEVDTDMDFFDGRYRVEGIRDEQVTQWQASAADIELSLPSANALMPENFALAEAVYTQKPKLVLEKPGARAFLMHSSHFREPKGLVRVNLNSDIAHRSARHQAKFMLLKCALNLGLTDLMAEASAAGMSLGVYESRGLNFSVQGFTDKHLPLLDSTLTAIKTYELSEDTLVNLKAALVSALESKSKDMLISQTFDLQSQLLDADRFSDQAVLAEVESITLAEQKAFRDEVLAQAHLNIFAFGNYEESEVLAITNQLEAHLPDIRQVSPIFQERSNSLAAGDFFSWQEDVDMSDVAIVDSYIVPVSDKRKAASGVLENLVHPDFYHQLRTEQQLGYVVGFYTSPGHSQLSMGYYVQSPAKGLSDIGELIAEFQEAFGLKLAETSSEEFAALKTSLLNALHQAPKNLATEAQSVITDWARQQLDFDSRQREINALEALTLEDVKALYGQMAAGSEASRLLLQMRGTEFQRESFAKAGGALSIDDADGFKRTRAEHLRERRRAATVTSPLNSTRAD